MGRRDLRTLVEGAVDDFKLGGKRLFKVDEVVERVEEVSGSPLPETARAMVRELLLSMWGSGFEPAALGGHFWKFGWGTPPVSREIGDRR